jgi:hypothetical protein
MGTPAIVVATVVSVLWLSLWVVAVKEKEPVKLLNRSDDLRFQFLVFHQIQVVWVITPHSLVDRY